jgi:CRP-like cAMP-binding protein
MGRHLFEHSLIKALRAVPEFASLDDHTLLALVGESVNLVWKAGSQIFEQGTTGGALFIVMSGEVLIYDGEGESIIEITRVLPGQYFGELSLLLDTTHTKSARAEKDSELLVLPKQPFQTLLEHHPDLDDHLRTKLKERVGSEGLPTR